MNRVNSIGRKTNIGKRTLLFMNEKRDGKARREQKHKGIREKKIIQYGTKCEC